MAHEITNQDGVVLFKQPAWHGLGTVIQEDIDPMQAMNVAGLDWKVGFPEHHVAKFGAIEVPIEKSRTLYRLPKNDKETYIELGSHGVDFEPLQNEELFNLAYALGAEVKVESAGSLFGGKKLWILLRGDTFGIKNDEVVKYMSIMNGHDGTLTLSALPTSVRIVCNNTLSMALREGTSKMFKVRHTKRIQEQVQVMKTALGKFAQTGQFFEDRSKQLADRIIKNEQELMSYWAKAYSALFGAPDADSPKDLKESVATLTAWKNTFESERAILGAEPSLWLAMNAVTGQLQHEEPLRKQNGWEERFMESKFYGQKSDLSIRAFNTALSMI